MVYLILSLTFEWPVQSLTRSVVGGIRSGANFCLSYLLTMVYLRYTRSGHLDIVAISWLAHSNSLIFATICHFPTQMHITVPSFPCCVLLAQYSSRKQQGSETLRVSARVSGSGSEGWIWAKHHNTRDNGGFMPLARNGQQLPETSRNREIRKLGERKCWADSEIWIVCDLSVGYILSVRLLLWLLSVFTSVSVSKHFSIVVLCSRAWPRGITI